LGSVIFSVYLEPFRHCRTLSTRIENVFISLPEEVQRDFLTDPYLRVSLDDCEPGRGRTVVMAQLGPKGTSRCVVLKPRLERCSESFACYIIAHELAHAYLHNGGWGEIADREDAADALAASWGFSKVPFEWV
jgi:hypothetical protein